MTKTHTTKVPESIGIILDGNRRWARSQGLSTLEGHRIGYERVKDTARWCKERGIKYLTVFAFSTENWNRTQEEVSYLMKLIKSVLGEEARTLSAEGVRIKFIGQLERFDKDIAEVARLTETETQNNADFTLVIALSYGGRADILQAAQKLLDNPPQEKLTEDIFARHLWTAGIPDPELIIRTSGEKRLSGFLTWNAVYSELFFLPVHWPAFSEKDLDAVLEEYANRERRHGK